MTKEEIINNELRAKFIKQFMEIHFSLLYSEISAEKLDNANAWFDEHEGEEMQEFELWCEGYLATGMEGEPQHAWFIGHYYGHSFMDAVQNCNAIHHCHNSEGDYIDISDSGNCYMWGCRVFDNEADARKSFG